MYDAIDRTLAQEKELHDYKSRLAAAYKERTGRELFVGGEPVSMLEATPPAAAGPPKPSMDFKHAQRFVKVVTKIPPMIFGLESRPTQEDLEDLAHCMEDYSRYHPEFAGEAWATWNLVLAALMVIAPWWGEMRAKRNNTWDTTKIKFEAAGYLKQAPITVKGSLL